MQYWSCRFNRPDSLKKHRTLQAAIRNAGSFGCIYDKASKKVYQVLRMAGSGELEIYDTVEQAASCSLNGFDMLSAMDSFGIKR
ncbi:hypothetical protein [Vibrio sp. D431a]|uniref:hypothetical protein n=1 Tax=Vibrio sp. D431a TaxID=2837388 RepID=UPI002552A35A|nr:hypothetical protein [Vibrio sp. D431a]MDK9793330.1 hypothetical protein [Vibrio sp. D431a]